METMAIIKFKAIDGKLFDDEKEALEYEDKLLEQYTHELCDKLTESQAKILKIIVDRNVENTTGFPYKLNQCVSRECFAKTDKNRF